MEENQLFASHFYFKNYNADGREEIFFFCNFFNFFCFPDLCTFFKKMNETVGAFNRRGKAVAAALYAQHKGGRLVNGEVLLESTVSVVALIHSQQNKKVGEGQRGGLL